MKGEAGANNLRFGHGAIRSENAAAPSDAGGKDAFHQMEKCGGAIRKGVVAERAEGDLSDPLLQAEQHRFRQQNNIAAGQIDVFIGGVGIGNTVVGGATFNATLKTPMPAVDVAHRQIDHRQRLHGRAAERREESLQPVAFGALPSEAVSHIDGNDPVVAGQIAKQDGAIEAAADKHGDGRMSSRARHQAGIVREG